MVCWEKPLVRARNQGHADIGLGGKTGMRDRQGFERGRGALRALVLAGAMSFGVAGAAFGQNATNPGAKTGPASAQGSKAGTADTNKTVGTVKMESSWDKDLKKFPGLEDELKVLTQRLMTEPKFPGPRKESQLLPLMPEGTVAYASMSNYGDTAAQALKIFRDELQKSAVLQDWWAHGESVKDGPKMLEAVEQFIAFENYVGDEMAGSLKLEGKNGKFLVVAETKKPGLKEFLQTTLAKATAAKTNTGIVVIGPEELATAQKKPEQLIVLVQKDFVAASTDPETLLAFEARLKAKNDSFAGTAFGKRVEEEYPKGLTGLFAGDLQTWMKKSWPEAEKSETFQQSGFADVQYAVWNRTEAAGKTGSQLTVTFSGKRHGAAAWIANPAPLGGLDFVSAKPMAALSLVLQNPGDVLEGAEALAKTAHSKMFDSLPGMEKMLGLSLKDDVLGLLGGEITLELREFSGSKADWRVLFSVKDAEHLEKNLAKLLDATHMETHTTEEGGVTYTWFQIPQSLKPMGIGYAFVDGYWIVGPGKEAVAETVRLKRAGEGLGKSAELQAAIPPGQTIAASGFLYEDPAKARTLQSKANPISLGSFWSLFGTSTAKTAPVTGWLYGEDQALRTMNSGTSADLTTVLVVAAIAIPNLVKSKNAENESIAIGTVRTIKTATVAYQSTYPTKGFASSLTVLGQDPRGPSFHSAEHSALLSGDLGCAGGSWCTKGGYRFKLDGVCSKTGVCTEFVVTATPLTTASGTRNFCLTSDGVVRRLHGEPLKAAVTVEECRTWAPL
jgi:type IV pilus assembly protein PilA